MFQRLCLLTLLTVSVLFAACGSDPPKGADPADTGVAYNPDVPEEPQEEPADEPEPEPEIRSITITAPVDGERVPVRRIRVRGTAENLSRVSVNGQSTEVVDGEWERFLLLDEGEVLIEATGDDAEPDSVTIVVDLSPPDIVIVTPERGTFVNRETDDTVLVSGYATDQFSSVTSVLVNGEEAELDDGAFSYVYVPAEGLNLLEIEAADELDHQTHVTRSLIFGAFGPRETLTTDALAVFLRSDGFNVIEEFAEPLIEEQLGTAIGGALGTGAVEITSFTYTSIGIDLAPADGYIATNLKMYGLQLDIRVEQDIWVTTLVIETSIFADPAELDAQIIPTVSEEGVIGIQFVEGTVELHNFRFELGDLPTFVTDLASGLLASVAELVMNLALSSFAFDELFDPSTLLRNIDLFGMTLQFDFLVTAIPITPAGLALWADAALYGEVEEARGPGPLYLEGELTELPAERMFNLLLAYNLINSVFFTFWELEALDLNLAELMGGGGASVPIPLNIAGFALIVGQELAEQYPPQAPVILELRPLLPPLGMPLLNPDEGAMSVFIGDMMIDFSVELPSGEVERWASAAVYMDLDVDLSWVDGGIVPEIALVSVIDLDDEPVIDLDDVAFEDALSGILDMIPGLVAGGLNEFGLGSFQGFELRDMVFSSLEKAPYLLVGADLAISEEPAPDGE